MLDNNTLIVIELLIPFSFMLIQFIEFGWSDRPAVKTNIMANFFQFLGFLLILFENRIQGINSLNLSNISIIVSSILMLATTFKLFKIDIPVKTFISLGLLSFIILFINPLLFRHKYPRLLVITAGLGLLFLYGIFYLYFNSPKNSRHLLRVMSIEFFLLSTASMFRFILILFFFKATDSFVSDDWASSIYMVEMSLLILVWNYTIQLKRNSIFRQELESSVKDLLKTQEDISILNYFYHENSSSSSLDEIYPRIFDLINERFLIAKAVLFVATDKVLLPVFHRGVSDSEIPILTHLDPETSISYKAYYYNEIKENYVEDYPDGDLKSFLQSKGLLGVIAFPLYTNGIPIGSLSVGIEENTTVVDRDKDIFLSVCTQVAGVIYNSKIHNELLHAQEELKMLASTDSLTGISNRRDFYKQLKREFYSNKRYEDGLTLFMVDLDDFKKINDNYGHDAGDAVLVEVTKVIKSHLRESDIFARYGGEEFVGVILRSNKLDTTKKLKDLIKKVQNTTIPNYKEIKITISIGSCDLSKDITEMEELIKKADIALYKAKKLGKNRFCESRI